MMGKGADGGFTGKTGGICANIGFDARNLPSSVSYQSDRQMGQAGRTRKGVDLFSQVLKALARRPMHGADDHVNASMSLSAGSATMNSAHASENKRKHRIKRSEGLGNLHRDHFESSWNRDPCVNQFWLHMDEYFRDLTSDDIQILFSKTKLSEMSVWNDWDPLFLMSPAGPSPFKDNGLEEHTKVEFKALERQEPQLMPTLVSNEDMKEANAVKVHEQESVQSVTGVKRKFLAASAVSKRKKLMAAATEVITTRISPPEHDDGELCHVCYGGDSSEQDQILFCDSCNVAVHQECYGIKFIPEGQWLCSWCSHCNLAQGERAPGLLPECVLCPVKGGAVKLVAGNHNSNKNSRETMFAHLFCCQWIPETFIRDVEMMEPIMNVEGVRDERRKLLCSVCKEKDGACIQCSHGMCATAFHPLCARQEKFRMEVSSKEGSKEIELCAFCSKHSIQAGKLPANKPVEPEAACETVEVNTPNLHLPSMVKDRRGVEKKQGERQGLSGEDIGGETSQDVEIVHSNIGAAESDVNFDEERRQRGLSGEASTSQDISCTQTAMGQPYNLATVQKGRQKPKRWTFEDQTQLDHINEFKREGGMKLPSSLPLLHANTQVSRKEIDAKQRSILDTAISVERWKMANCRKDVLESKVSPTESVAIREESSIPRPKNGSTHLNVHPFIKKRLQEVRRNTIEKGYKAEDANSRLLAEGFSESDDFFSVSSPSVEVQERLVFERDHSSGSSKVDLVLKPGSVTMDDSLEAQKRQLEHARRLGILDLGLQDELEEEVLALQERLIVCAEKNHYQCERLISKVITNLSDELQASQKRAKNLMLVNQYLSELREAKKQGRKERRNKEAQAVLAAATAAAAASPRVGSLRRDGPGGPHIGEAQYPARGSTGEMVQTTGGAYSMPATSHLSGVGSLATPALSKPLKVNIGVGRTSSSSRTSSREKASMTRQVDGKELVSRSHGIESSPAESRDELSSCDICTLKDCSPLKSIIACHRCKVAVHQDCYGISTVPIGDWYCQPCSEIFRQFQVLRAPEAVDRGRPGHGVACALCSGQSGAFKRCLDGGWAHVFCAQWIPETTVGKDQTGMVEGLKLIPMDRFLQQCSICHRQQGACLRCSFGHCHGAFHPSCARDSGLYMSVKCNPGGRIQYRAYCERHSPQQREKAESRRCGSSDELNALKQMRVELERVRIICERICRRERIKRDRLICMRDLYVAHMSALPHTMMASNDLSSTSNSLDTPITLYKKNSSVTDNQQNGSMAVKPQRPESESYSWNSVAGEVSRYQDSPSGDSVYQTQLSCSEPSRSQIGSSVAPVYGQGRHTAVIGAVVKSDDQKRPKKHRKQAETLHTEVVMTPTEASVQNQRLPKGYAYVPVVLLSRGKMNPSESSAPNEL